MNAPSEDVKDMLLADTELGLTFAEDLFINREPATPDNVVTIFDSYGSPPYIGLTNTGYEYPSIQIRARGNDSRVTFNLLNEIYLSLHGRAHETWNDTLYESIICTNVPTLLDWDDNGRCRFIINLNLQRR